MFRTLQHKTSQKLRFRRLFLSVGSKILLLVCGLTFLTCFLIGGYFYNVTSRNAITLQMNRLSSQTKQISPFFQTVFNDLQTDTSILAQSPPLQGLIRSIQNNGVDPQTGFTQDLWARRLEDTFSALLYTKPSYVQMRFVGIKDNGRELVRVNRNDSKIEVVAPEYLQEKGNEEYFKSALQQTPGKIYYSGVSLNREKGKIQEPFLPVVRAILPIYNNNGNAMGMLVINAAYALILDNMLSKIEFKNDLYAVNENGDYIAYTQGGKERSFHFKAAGRTDKDNKIVEAILASPSQSDTVSEYLSGEKYIAHFFKQNFSLQQTNRFIAIALIVPEEKLLEPVFEVQHEAFILACTVMMIALFCAVLFATVLTAPLKAMTKQIYRYQHAGHTLNLPVKLHDEVGDLARAFETLISNLKLSEQKEANARMRLQAIMDGTVDGLITIDKFGVVQDYNKACEMIFGYSAQEVQGQNVKMLMPAPYHGDHDKYLANYHTTHEKKIIGIGREVEGRRKDGSVFPIDLSVSEVKVDDNILYSGIVRDITDRKKAEEEIMHSNEELERFAYIASHDLQEPLRMVSNFTLLLEDEYGGVMDETAQQYMRFTIDAAQRMQDLVNDLLEYSRIGNEDAGFSMVNTTSHVDMALTNLQEIIKESGAVITVGDMPVIYASPLRFLRLMQNLIGNAIKYRKPDMTPNVIISAKEQENDWLFSVQDNGIGMKEEYLEQIFIIFKRLHNKQDYKGTGIGLSVCRRIVENFGGKIWAVSKPEQGSTFYFTIPKREV